ncbi:hypothetical protein M0802_000685 [Mischocyttarus mexicanus]|nr:hypothetical protein M0802_000685 [Mischocyttarus mexicanus]
MTSIAFATTIIAMTEALTRGQLTSAGTQYKDDHSDDDIGSRTIARNGCSSDGSISGGVSTGELNKVAETKMRT